MAGRPQSTSWAWRWSYGILPKLESLGDLTVRRVTCAEELTDFAGVFAANWEPPDPPVFGFYQSAAPLLLQDQCPMKLFLGYLDDEPVASSELFLTGRIAGLYSVCTRRACRERGIGSALTWTALDDARRRGIPTAVLQSSDRERGMYTRLGFNACCNFADSLRAEIDSLPAGLSFQASGTEWI